ncbi:MAG TPA: ATP-dependent helicase HrpB [Desulfobulbaceae bacterium]|nr:ATP-dependent helicase HrpB [Desulfobulbaceae bacterium]
MAADLPVSQVLPELRQHLCAGRGAVLCAPPGSGKTTVAPLSLRAEPWLAGRTIILVEPRRLAARLAAVYMAEQLGEEAGLTVGYQVRFDRRITAATRIEVVTEGILLRRLQQDPELAGVGLVIFDEFHERSLDGDFALALCLEVRAALRDDLRLLVMSATLDPAPVSRLLGDAPVVACGTIQYPVAVVHLPPPAQAGSSRGDHLAAGVAAAVRHALREQAGDILAFLPGTGEIRQAQELLKPLAAADGLSLLPLYGELSLAEQGRAVRPDPRGRRRVILATTIAETSITIEGISAVVDCGWKRVPRFDPNSGLIRLATVRISRASAIQRQGRAGRLGPGVCYRLWSMDIEQGLQAFDRPEILEADLAGLALHLAAWGSGEADQLQWLDPPPKGALAQARTLLVRLGALDANLRITRVGRSMVALPLHPRLARMLLQGERLGCGLLACDLAALLSERDLIRGRDHSVDIGDRLHLLREFRADGAGAVRPFDVDPGACRRIDQVSRQLRRLLTRPASRQGEECSLGALLAPSFPDRLARQRSGSGHNYKLTSGRGASLAPHDPLSASPYLVITDLDAGKGDGRVFQAAPLTRQEVFDLFANALAEEDEVVWDEKAGAVAARRLVRLDALVVEERPLPHPDPESVRTVLLAAIRQGGLEILPWNAEARAFQERVRCLALWQPGAKWPDLSDACLRDTVAEWLGPSLSGIRSREQLRSLNLTEILRGLLDWRQQQKLAQDAPTHIEVPSGSRIRVRYAVGEAPVLAVRLQEMFGLADTPTVCGGNVPVTLHLLSPARRPLQVTSDLRGFWDGSYHQVKKEMKGRYPKHHWPEDPWQALPTARSKPKK